jgi:glycine/D-amino acid oxidase-like deaminating enzyme
MTPRFDVLILGGGLAAAGLACNLRRAGFTGSVAVLEKERLGAARAYGYRNTFAEVVREYGIPHRKVFRGLRDAITVAKGATRWMDIDIPCYFYH